MQTMRYQGQGYDVRSVLNPKAYDGLMEMTWDLGALQSAPDIDGAYTDIPGATSPYLEDPDQAREFFRAEN